MNEYTAKFTGREVGAIGITNYIVTHVKGEDEERAKLNLYKRYEHISSLTLEKHGSN